MNGFHEIQFPADISYGASGGPAFAVDIVKTKAEIEQRNLNRPEGLCKYDVKHGVKNRSQYTRLLTFFRARKGKTYGFRYKDWFDYQAFGQGLGTGTVAEYQLIKTYADEGGFDVRIIRKPVQGTLKVYLDGSPTSNFTCDYTTGILRFPSPPGQVVTVDFEFDVPVRFDLDQMAASYDEFQIISWDNISLVEVLD